MVKPILVEADLRLREDEIAIRVENGSIFSLRDSLDRLFGAYEFEPWYSFWKPNDVVQIYRDVRGNILAIEYYDDFITEKHDGYEFQIMGFSVNPMAELYVPALNQTLTINLGNYIRVYPGNVFLETLEKIREYTLAKGKIIEKDDRLMYI